MEIYCSGRAELHDEGTDAVFFIEPDELDWEIASSSEESMGPQYLHQATIEHEVLGTLQWTISEYPEGAISSIHSPEGHFKIIQDFDFEVSGTDEEAFEEDISAAVHQIEMWFKEHYSDPANEMPYSSKEGYSYPWGGPYDATEEIYDKFAEKYPKEILDAAIKAVESDGILEWAPSGKHPDQIAAAQEYLDSERDHKNEDEPSVVNCEVCNTRAEAYPANGDYLLRGCPRCGEYKMSRTAEAMWRPLKDPVSIAKLSGWIRRENRGSKLPDISSNTIQDLADFKLPDVRQRANLLLLEAASGQKKLGEHFSINEHRFVSASFSQDQNEVHTLYQILSEKSLLTATALGGRTEIHPSAYEYIERLKASKELDFYLYPQATNEPVSGNEQHANKSGVAETGPEGSSSESIDALTSSADEPAGLTKDDTPTSISFATTFADTVNSDAKDHLLVEIEANAFARLIASKEAQTPLSIGIFGRWGSGKSFFLDRISQGLQTFQDNPNQNFHQKIVQIEFNAWHYMETNVWASLVDVIFKGLDKEFKSNQSNGKTNLFDTLVTAQELRLDAIENVAKSLSEVRKAQIQTAEAQKKLVEEGPSGEKLWTTVRETFTKANNQTLIDATKAIGFDGEFATKTEGFRQFISDFERLRSEGSLFATSFKLEATKPGWLLTLGLGVAVIPIALGMMPDLFEALGVNQPLGFLGSTAILTSAWGARACSATRTAMKTLGTFNNMFEKAKTDALSEGAKQFEQALLDHEHAKEMLKAAEKRAGRAHERLVEETPGKQLASFISERASSGEYSEKLGIIATIRKDFEQLSLLMAQEKDHQATTDRLKEIREQTKNRIASIKSSYKDFLDPPDGKLGSEAQEISEALKGAEKALNEDHDDPAFTRIVLKIDDLDRCPSSKVAEVLQAIHLFLNFPLFVVVVCVDERWLSASLKSEYKDLLYDGSGASPSDYLEKIFQIPYWTRALTSFTSEKFAEALLSRPELNASTKTEALGIVRKTETHFRQLTSEEARKYPEGKRPLYVEDPPSKPQSLAEGLKGLRHNNNDRKKAKLHRLSLSTGEKRHMARVAILAGDTPRRTVRFINVYLLLKSTLASPEVIRIEEDEKYSLALATLVALCTRGDNFSKSFLRILLSVEGSFECLAQLVNHIDNAVGSQHLSSEVEAILLETLLSDFVTVGRAKIASTDAKKYLIGTGKNKQNSPLNSPRNRELASRQIRELKQMANIAKRYTFMASGEHGKPEYPDQGSQGASSA